MDRRRRSAVLGAGATRRRRPSRPSSSRLPTRSDRNRARTGWRPGVPGGCGRNGRAGAPVGLVESLFVPDTPQARISPDTVAKVARLARLDVSSAEVDRLTNQLAGMLEHFADIDALDLAATEPMTQPYPLVNVMRDDVVKPSLDRDEVLAAAPAAEDGRFRVPPIIGLEG
ncbi:MAG: Asp-tRNA(Asn)/Glu-tRNA(Gln) amidotransferase GatCAB subunit C [Acidimicrobiales bacterium mtb01]|nr:Asp-tRNA(Asn)/Glu-tRNA(Gln) amidotransferase subunit GatC [Actinomycetota bacterium]TEX45847.1 MAG: Asp-tRNA(Asn)/Glu-tRNA(Gln) amidotransferase GatCAB subunit C [Acidimicrobiales bacterium mtb01]